MSHPFDNLEPQPLWNFFANLNAVPRASKNESQVIQFMVQFGANLGLETQVDAVGNVIIRKPGCGGLEDHPAVVLQSHLDMVHQKNANVEFDFATQGIDMFVEGDWVKARGTTLGADNGIGVATIMALLASSDIPHPPLEALLTIDEETGMTGAQGLVGGLLRGKCLLNLDTEDDNELTIGCAGGCDVSVRGSYHREPTASNSTGFEIAVRGLQGGHSGCDIHLGRGNANKLMNRILWHGAQHDGLRIARIDGGGLRNAIPRESFATIVIEGERANQFDERFAQLVNQIVAEYEATDAELEITLAPTETPQHVLPHRLQQSLLAVIYGCPNGIHRMSPTIPNLVQTSNNLARVLVQDGEFAIHCLTRSSVNSERDDLANAISGLFSLLGGSVELTGRYPGWEPSPDASIVRLMTDIYSDLFDEQPHVSAVHAGLECGILGTHYPEMEMISFGPNIRGAHSPDERVQISSVQKFWRFLLATLKQL